MVTRTTARRPAAKRPATPLPKKPVSKAAPAAKKAPARPAASAPDPRAASLAKAREARAAKAAAAKAEAESAVEVHPTKKEEITAHDVLRARHTYEVLYSQWLRQQGEDIAEVLDFVAPILDDKRGVNKKSPLTRAKVAPEERVIDEYYDRDVVEGYNIKDLRTLAADLASQGIITEKVKKPLILEQMEAAGLFREDGDVASAEDDEDEDADAYDEEDEGDSEEDLEEEGDEDEDESDDDDVEEETFTRADLKAMTLKELQDIAEINEVKWKGLDKASLIDELLGAEDEEEEADEAEEEDEDGEFLEIDPNELPNMDLDELLEICDQIDGLKVPAVKRKNKKAVIELILEALGEE